MAIVNDGDPGFLLGANSVDDPERLPAGMYVRSMNSVNRGGMVQCRPGFKWKFNLPNGVLQGLAIFRPIDTGEQLVFAVGGKIYTSAAPYTEYRQLPHLTFSPVAREVFFCATSQAVKRNDDLTLTLILPKSVLFIQDGVSAPGYWDGSESGQITGGVTEGKTPLGTAMCWTGGRLWVARGQRIYSSDIVNPFSFLEGQYVGATGSFVLPGRVTALAEIPDAQAPVLAAFTENTTTFFQSNIRVRELWPTVQNFQLLVFPSLGAVSSRGVCAHNGLFWWFSQYGLVNLDLAFASKRAGKLQFMDDNMAASKGYLYTDLASVAMSSHENYLLTSVPFGDKYNRHTWVMDAKGDGSWNSYWTGIRPVQWVSGAFNGASRIFCVSKDLDGGNRLWEAFSSERKDECTPITWTLETRSYTGGNLNPKQFRWVEIHMAELAGEVDVFAGWAGTRKGRFQEVLSKHISSLEGSLSSDREVVFNKNEFALKKQSRVVRTEEQRLTDPDDLSACGVTSDREDWIDTGFQICIMVNGPGAIRAVKVYYEPEPDQPQGKCEEQETDKRAERFDGGSAHAATEVEVLDLLQETEEIFYSTKSNRYSYAGLMVEGNANASTTLSQVVADKIAQAAADCRAAVLLAELATPHKGSFIKTKTTTSVSYSSCASVIIEV